MKDKILFFVDGWFLNFGMAELLQKKTDMDFYAIINFEDKSKKFFQEQEIVSFKKIWFFQDEILKNKIKSDHSYLKNIENKYGINLWKLIYSDLYFTHYNKFYKFSYTEILSILEQECKFFERILDEIKPNFLSIYLTSVHFQELLCELCKARNIELLILGPSRFGSRMLISKEGLMIDDVDKKMKNTISPQRNYDELLNYLKKFDSSDQVKSYTTKAFEQNTLLRYKAIIKFFICFRDKNFKKRYYNFGKSKFKVFNMKISNRINKKIRNNFINKHLVKSITHSKYIYFPLQTEPERVILLNAAFYTNQISIIENIAKSIPMGYKLLVKEHPGMKVVGPWRPISFYKQIMDLPNVILLHYSVSNEIAMKNSDLVITIAGTSGQEALFHKKPVLTFTNQIYSCIPSSKIIENLEDLPNLIKESINIKVNSDDLNKFVNIIEENTFQLDYIAMTTDFAYRFGFKGPIMDAELLPSKIEKYLNDYKEQFEILSEEHLKKINEYKRNVEQ